MKPVSRIRILHSILKLDAMTTVVDIGANPFAGTPPYGTFRRSDCCHVIGFEPQQDALKSLLENARSNDTFLPYAIGDGSPSTLYITKNSGLVSTLKPLDTIGSLLGNWWTRAVQIKSSAKIDTKRLDDVEEVRRVDFLKIDIQGGELSVFQNARQKLRQCCAIQTEICLHPYYENQPSFGDIQAEMTAQGFIAHKFVETSAHPLQHNLTLPDGVSAPKSQITVADLIFIKDPTHMSDLETDMIKHMALISYSVFRSFDLTMRCLSELAKRGIISERDTAKAVEVIYL